MVSPVVLLSYFAKNGIYTSGTCKETLLLLNLLLAGFEHSLGKGELSVLLTSRCFRMSSSHEAACRDDGAAPANTAAWGLLTPQQSPTLLHYNIATWIQWIKHDILTFVTFAGKSQQNWAQCFTLSAPHLRRPLGDIQSTGLCIESELGAGKRKLRTEYWF